MQISINVGSDIMYVGGTVNGVNTLFEALDGHTFVANVEQSYDDKYNLDLQLIDEAGNKSTYHGTFEYIIPFFVYDRTQFDVDLVKDLNQKYIDGTITEEEKKKWNIGIHGKVGLKGAFNLCDMNRNENNCKIIGNLVSASVETKEWEYGDIPRVSDYQRIVDNVQKIRDAYATLSNTPATPVRPLNTYKKWNDIERILHDVFYVYTRSQNNFNYCGAEMYAGEGIGDI